MDKKHGNYQSQGFRVGGLQGLITLGVYIGRDYTGIAWDYIGACREYFGVRKDNAL